MCRSTTKWRIEVAGPVCGSLGRRPRHVTLSPPLPGPPYCAPTHRTRPQRQGEPAAGQVGQIVRRARCPLPCSHARCRAPGGASGDGAGAVAVLAAELEQPILARVTPSPSGRARRGSRVTCIRTGRTAGQCRNAAPQRARSARSCCCFLPLTLISSSNNSGRSAPGARARACRRGRCVGRRTTAAAAARSAPTSRGRDPPSPR
jgi:hypothetical protein